MVHATSVSNARDAEMGVAMGSVLADFDILEDVAAGEILFFYLVASA